MLRVMGERWRHERTMEGRTDEEVMTRLLEELVG